jgi:hypothetical protein
VRVFALQCTGNVIIIIRFGFAYFQKYTIGANEISDFDLSNTNHMEEYASTVEFEQAMSSSN